MQSAVKHNPKLRLSLVALACQMVCMGAAFAQSDAAPAAKPATETVTITGRKVGMGLMVQEDVPKARSTVTAEELAKQRPTGNAYDALALLPAVNTYGYDATGLFGGGLTLRGFNSDQIGATINGVPVNDSGNFAVFPQEYVDQENTCTTFVTQGSTDVDSPQVGATGGNFGITTCEPEDKQRFRVAQSLGQLSMFKTYLRYDTGRFWDNKAKVFISVSQAKADKWKGAGEANRKHMDIGFNYDWDRFNYIHGTVLYNRQFNNNLSTFNLADLNKNGYYYDYSTTFIGHAPASPGKAVSDPAQNNADSYYKLAMGPFENVIASATAKFRIGENTDIKFLPYVWYGYGTGGVQQKLQQENAFLNTATGKFVGVDLNGDGDTLDKVWVYNSSITRTQRPGASISVTHNWNNHQILAGFWYERATHRQTGPMEKVDNNGNTTDIWLRDGLVTRPDGSPYESRDWKSISTAFQGFIQDTATFIDDKLTVNVGLRTPHVKRDFTNYANEGTVQTSPNSGVTYRYNKTYSTVLPQLGLRYRITNDDQLFASLAKNMKAPPNFVYSTTNGNLSLINNIPTLLGDVRQETSMNLDMGYRHQTTAITTQATIFFSDFKDRQATAFDPSSQTSTLTNVGKVKNKGFEVEAGNTPVNGWSFYASLGYSSSEIKEDLQAGKGIYLPTKGNQFPLTPKWKGGLSASYETNSWYTRLKAKVTSNQQATLANDELVPGYTTLDFDAGYQFPSGEFFKNPKLTLNVSNLTDRQYRNPSSQSVTNATAYPGVTAKNVFYYLGAPRFVSATLRVDF
ncbi:TonB-dependent receptor [Duganella sp. HH105]|uniref:TonB-dependent receptor n=1 Tax=Duganella sp. HH105 TaxID=1781067 RepID=UPI000877DE84|nr:TonB-dependent receptor [Duganella sp. HH105]OEZ62500.1 Fe(3+) dicitrate transport protein FecA precursor [Duganella sp. HH105]